MLAVIGTFTKGTIIMRGSLIGAATLAFVLAPDAGGAQQTVVGQPPQDDPGHRYVSFDMSLGAATDPAAGDIYRADHSLAFGGSFGVGYVFGPLRLEGQLRYESFLLNNLNPAPDGPITAADTLGDLSGFGVMGNVLYDFGASGGVRPFVGLGGGFLHLSGNYRKTACGLCPFESGPRVVGGSETVLAGQAMAGFRIPRTSKSGEWFIGYRYLKTDDVELNIVGFGPVTQDGTESHSLLVGVVYPFPR